MPFDALETSLDAIRALKIPLRSIRSRDHRLAAQIRSAASSMALNLAEGHRREGRDRQHHFRIAAGSADEARATLRVAVAWGDLKEESTQEALALLDRVLAMCWRMTR